MNAKATSVVSTKGGVGKSTTAANLGAFCADAGLKTSSSTWPRPALPIFVLRAS